MVNKITSIRITDQTHERLQRHGKYKDSIDAILNRLLDFAEGKIKSV